MEEKFIDEKKLVKYVDEQLGKCKKDGYELQAYLNLSYFAGHQWVKLDRTTNRLVEPTLEPWQVRFTANKIQPIVRTELAKVTKNKIVMFVNPATTDDSDVKAARTAEKFNEWLEYALSLQEKDSELVLWGLTTGMAFMKPYWNPAKGRKIEYEGREIHEGDIDCCVVSIFEIKFDTSCSKWEDVTWVCHDKIRTVDYIKEVYGIDVQPESNLTTTNLYEAKLATQSSAGVGVSYQKAENSAVVHEYWELPSNQYKYGRRITTCGDKVLLYLEDIGFGEADETERELPFFPFFHIKVPGRLVPTCIVEQLIPIQREYNKSRSQIIENKNLVGNPPMLVPIGSLLDGEEPNNEPGQIIYYNAGAGKPDYMEPPSMNADVYKNIDLLDGEFEFVSGQHETSHGTTPTGVTSGTAIGFLQEQDDTKLGPTISNFIYCKQKYKRYMLKMAQKRYDEEREIRIVGDNRRSDIVNFKGSDLTSIDVRVNEATMFQTSKAAMQDFIIKMVQYGLLLPQNENDRALIMKVLEFGIMDDVYTEMEQDTSQAQNENSKWQRGDVTPDVRDFYNHEAHIKEHDKFRKSESYAQLDDGVKNVADKHVALHYAYLEQSILKAAQAQMTQQMMHQPPAQQNTEQTAM